MIIQVGFADYLAIFSRSTTSSLVQSQLADHGKLKALPYSVLCKAIYSRKSGWSAKPPGTGAHVASCIACTVLLCDWFLFLWSEQESTSDSCSYDQNRNQHLRRHQHEFKLAEYCGEMDSVSLLMTQSSLEVLGKQILFLCVMAPSSPKRFVWRIKFW